MSIGYSSPINGSNVAFSIYAKRPQNAGGAIQGWMPQTTQNVDKTYPNYEQIRYTLKNAWNTTYPSQLRNAYPSQLQSKNLRRPITTPFRAVNNAGDLLSRDNFSCGGSCQTPQSRPGLHGLRTHFGSVSVSCTPSAAYNSLQQIKNVPAAACNVKYVYDSSDYVTYLKQKAINKNYNDFSNGGDDFKASQSAQRAIRRY
jgi:hypothetical protein